MGVVRDSLSGALPQGYYEDPFLCMVAEEEDLNVAFLRWAGEARNWNLLASLSDIDNIELWCGMMRLVLRECLLQAPLPFVLVTFVEMGDENGYNPVEVAYPLVCVPILSL